MIRLAEAVAEKTQIGHVLTKLGGFAANPAAVGCAQIEGEAPGRRAARPVRPNRRPIKPWGDQTLGRSDGQIEPTHGRAVGAAALEIGGQGRALVLGHGHEDPILGIEGMAGDIKLGGDPVAAADGDLVVNMGGPPSPGTGRIGHRHDGAKSVTTLGVGRDPAETLKAGIQGPVLAAPIARMVIAAEVIALPDLDHGTGDGSASAVDDLALDFDDIAFRAAIRDPAQIPIIFGKRDRIERTLGLRRGGQALGRLRSRPANQGSRRPTTNYKISTR